MAKNKKLKKDYKKYKAKVEAESKGLGDTIEKITKATGIKKLVEWVAGEDCGCDERQQRLNRLFRYNKPLCLEEDEYNYLHNFFNNHKGMLKPQIQKDLLKIYNRVFKTKKEMSNCSSCIRTFIGQLEIIYTTYIK